VGQTIVLCRLPTVPEGGRPQSAVVCPTKVNSIDLKPELQATLTHLAAVEGCDADTLVREAIERKIGRGEVLTHEEAGARLERLLTKKQSAAMAR